MKSIYEYREVSKSIVEYWKLLKIIEKRWEALKSIKTTLRTVVNTDNFFKHWNKPPKYWNFKSVIATHLVVLYWILSLQCNLLITLEFSDWIVTMISLSLEFSFSLLSITLTWADPDANCCFSFPESSSDVRVTMAIGRLGRKEK